MFETKDFDFDLPENLIATQPFFPKEKTKMLFFDGEKIIDSQVINLVNFLQEGDLIIFNDVKVIKAKFKAEIVRNLAKIEFNLDQEKNGFWNSICKPAKKIKQGDVIKIADDFFAEVIEKKDDGFIKIKFNCDEDEAKNKIEKYGLVPIPPYIKRDCNSEFDDKKNYQTIYAKNGCGVAAPTAGLHFTQEIFSMLEKKKIKTSFITLNVGAGTFLPVRSKMIKDHKMHQEFFSISDETAKLINQTKQNGGRIIAVGTTVLRSLESCVDQNKNVISQNNFTDIFIFPPYEFKVVDVLLTNFHLPKSTLFMLVSAFIGKENARMVYQHAINNSYRFYSYGDCCLFFNHNCKK